MKIIRANFLIGKMLIVSKYRKLKISIQNKKFLDHTVPAFRTGIPIFAHMPCIYRVSNIPMVLNPLLLYLNCSFKGVEKPQAN